MSKIQIYGDISSPPTRAVVTTCEIIGIPYELKSVDALNMSEEFKNLTPQKEFPVLVDDGFALPESRAIMQYLADKYAKDDSLYPKDIKGRAVVNARMYFENGTLCPKIAETYLPLFSGEKIGEEALKSLGDKLEVVEKFLIREKWIAGPKMTIADISYGSTISTLALDEHFNISSYSKITIWLDECRKNPIFKKFDDEGLKATQDAFNMLKEKGIIKSN